jgi:hypothetical protein
LKDVGGIALHLQDSIDEIVVEGRRPDDNARHVLRGSVRTVIDYLKLDDGLEKDLAFLRTQREWTFDDEPLLSREYERKCIAMNVGQRLNDDLAEHIRALRILRAYCVSTGDSEMADAVRSVMRIHRSKALGRTPSARDLDGLTLIGDIETRKLPTPPLWEQ